MTTVVADMTETRWIHMELKSWNACHGRQPSTSVIDLTPGGGWMASPCSVLSGAKRAGSHRRPKMLQYLLLWHLDTGQQSNSSLLERREILLS